jgi:hypothetical protein
MKKTIRAVVHQGGFRLSTAVSTVVVAVAVILFAGCSDNPVSSGNGNNSGNNGTLVYDRGKVDSVKEVTSQYHHDSIPGNFDFTNCDSVIYTYSAITSYLPPSNPEPYIGIGYSNWQGSINITILQMPNDPVYHDYRISTVSPKCSHNYIWLVLGIFRQWDYLFVKNFKIWKK